MTHAIHKRRLLAVLTAAFALFALLLMHPTAGAVDEEDELIGANIQDGVLLGCCTARAAISFSRIP